MEKIEERELKDAKHLILDFIGEYQQLYEDDDMKYNLHAHVHLPMQVWRFGPLHKTSCFAFENIFRISNELFHGTRGFESQIANNLIVRKQNKMRLNELFKKTLNHNIKYFISNLIPIQKSLKNQIIRPQIIEVKNLMAFERHKIFEKFGHLDSIKQGYRALIHHQGIININILLC